MDGVRRGFRDERETNARDFTYSGQSFQALRSRSPLRYANHTFYSDSIA